MRLYPKKLRSIEDLEQEKKRLLREKKLLDEDEFLSFNGLLGKNKSGGKEKDGEGEWSLIDLLPVSNPLVSMIVKKAIQWASKKESRSKKGDEVPHKEDKPRKSLLTKAAFEFIGGYLKWKAIELSCKGIKHLLKKKRSQHGSPDAE